MDVEMEIGKYKSLLLFYYVSNKPSSFDAQLSGQKLFLFVGGVT